MSAGWTTNRTRLWENMSLFRGAGRGSDGDVGKGWGVQPIEELFIRNFFTGSSRQTNAWVDKLVSGALDQYLGCKHGGYMRIEVHRGTGT